MTYWNAFVANLELHGQGNFYVPIGDPNFRQGVGSLAAYIAVLVFESVDQGYLDWLLAETGPAAKE